MTDIDGAVGRLRVALSGGHAYPAIAAADVRALLADRARLLSRNAELERALEPIARVGRAMIQPLPDDDRMFTVLPAGDGPGVALYRGDLRAAARALTKES